VASGRIAAREGSSANPDLTIETPFEVWMDIMTRKADGQQMFLDQKYRVTGDLALMIALFKRDEGHRD
jgi:putative sterol carrier protein